MALELHQTPLLPPQVQEHFSQQIFQVFLVDGPRGVEAVEASVGDVERCSELMGGTVCGVAVDAPQTFHGIRCAQQTGNTSTR